ncbi:MAG: hypothetical protein NPIRA02_02810 [Nitrospirales bacterium]|nr:MAG: hypothetical protein NPIRA02_02810 [Nitrospirales bacterium]
MGGLRVKTSVGYVSVLCIPVILGLLSCSTPSPSVPGPENPAVQIPQEPPLPLPHSLGILPFDVYQHDAPWGWLRKGLPEMLVTDLTLASDIHIISRQSLGDVLREQWIQHRGMTDPGSAVKLGQLSGARYLLKGSVYHHEARLSVDIHVLDVERGVVVRASRVTGTVDDVPTLERNVSQRIGEWFGAQGVSNDSLYSKRQHVRILRPTPSATVVPNSSDISEFHDLVDPPQAPILAFDVPLRLDTARRLREEAWLFADVVWQRGFVIELDASADAFTVSPDEGTTRNGESLWISVSASFRVDRLRSIHPALEVSRLPADDRELEEGKLVWKSEANAARLFTERFRVPRRLFVRAMSQSGEVLAVSSPGTWRVDKTIAIDDSGAIRLGLSPDATIVGQAEFPQNILRYHQRITHFDAVVVPVSDERRIVSVEILEPANETARNDAVFHKQHIVFERRLKQWFLDRWRPPVTESLPVQGYLPGNRRTIHLRVHGKNGIVEDVRVVQGLHEDVLRSDVEVLMNALRGYCIDVCQGESRERVETTHVFAARIQLDLIKDLSHIGFGYVDQ